MLSAQERKRIAYDKWYASHREEYLAVRRAQYASDPMSHRKRANAYSATHPEKRRATFQRWYAANQGYSGRHYHSTPHRTEVHKLCKALHSALSNNRSGRDWYRNSKLGPLIGCSKPDLIAHIEAQFRRGMSWANYGRGGWEIDHIKPCASFDLTDPAQRAACFHYTNLRPLWRLDNLQRPKKGGSHAL